MQSVVIAYLIITCSFLYTMILQRYGKTYSKNTLLFVWVYIFSILILVASIGFEPLRSWFTLYGFVLFSTASILFLLACLRHKQLYAQTIPRIQISHDLYNPDIKYGLVKILDVFFQNLIILITVETLIGANFSYFETGLILSTILFLFHLPAPYMYDRLFGYSFLFLPSIFAFTAPFLIDTYSFGIHVIFAFQLFIYILIPTIFHLK